MTAALTRKRLSALSEDCKGSGKEPFLTPPQLAGFTKAKPKMPRWNKQRAIGTHKGAMSRRED